MKYIGLSMCLLLGNVWAADKAVLPAVPALQLTPAQGFDVLSDEMLERKASKALFKQGVFKNNVDITNEEQYRAYYLARKDVRFFQFRVVALDVNYVDTYVGCCPTLSGSFVMTPETGADMAGLGKFAKQKQCTVQSQGVLDHLSDEAAVKLVSKYKTKNFWSISCDYQ